MMNSLECEQKVRDIVDEAAKNKIAPLLLEMTTMVEPSLQPQLTLIINKAFRAGLDAGLDCGRYVTYKDKPVQ